MKAQFRPYTEEEFDTLKAKHSDLYAIETAVGVFLARMPARTEVDRAVKKSKEEPLDANAQLAEVCTVYPDRATTQSLLNRFPGLIGDIADALLLISKGKVDPAEKESGTCAKPPGAGT